MSEKFTILSELVFHLFVCTLLFILGSITTGEFVILLLLILYFCNNQLEHYNINKKIDKENGRI